MKNAYEIRGDATVIFINHKGVKFEVLIDTVDLPILLKKQTSWFIHFDPSTKRYYVYSTSKKPRVLLHRFLLNAPNDLFVDHKNHNTLDNRKDNLRIATNSENQQNRQGATSRNRFGVLGVYWGKRDKKWVARLMVNRKYVLDKKFDHLEDAERAVYEARAKYMPFSKEYTAVKSKGVPSPA